MRLLLPLFLALTACRNDCQQLCLDMADYAEECGHEFPKDQVKSCLDNNANKNLNDAAKDSCTNELPYLREEWTCDDIGLYFDSEGSSDGGDGGDGGSSDTGD